MNESGIKGEAATAPKGEYCMTALAPYQRDRAREARRRREDPGVFDVSGNGSAERMTPAGHGATPGQEGLKSQQAKPWTGSIE